MGLTHSSTGLDITCKGLSIKKLQDNDRILALAGNPNVGKSTLFNALTGLNQHTGNWPGKTVNTVSGSYRYEDVNYILVDLPGTYSLMAHSCEEEVARDYICYGGADAVIVICDATCLERNLNLVLQTIEITPNVIVCINLMDEASKKGIRIQIPQLEKVLGVPVVPISARNESGLKKLKETIALLTHSPLTYIDNPVLYPNELEEAAKLLEPILNTYDCGKLPKHWLALRVLARDEDLLKSIQEQYGITLLEEESINLTLLDITNHLSSTYSNIDVIRDVIASTIVRKAEDIASLILEQKTSGYSTRDKQIDRILTSKKTGLPIMAALLCAVLWLTLTGANYPSMLLSKGLFWLQDQLLLLFDYLGAPAFVSGVLILGLYRVLAWVISVMLPPMAIFFPLFTLLEDLGYLPRVAFNLDHAFKKCNACGKQCLTMCMGLGCNAAGVIGCRIIDSKRERLIAILTNSFVPCNGRFPQPLKEK